MTILTANLKHLYQRRGLWFVHGLIAFTSWLLIFSQPEKAPFLILVVFSNLTGLIACAMQTDIAVKPFSFCLPGHRKARRQFLFIVAIAINLLFALVFLRYPGVDEASNIFLVITAAFFVGMICYWLGTAVAFAGNVSAGFLGFYPLIGILAKKYELYVEIENVIFFLPKYVIMAGIAVSIAVWLFLASDSWARKHCGAMWLGFFDAWNWQKARSHVTARNAAKLEDGLISKAYENFCLTRISQTSGRIAPNLWGSVYSTYGHIFCKGKLTFSTLAFMFIIAIAIGYLPPELANMVFVVAGIAAINTALPVHSTLLISGGRNERFYSTFIIVISIAVIVTLSASLVAMLTWPLENIMPPLTLKEGKAIFHAVSLRAFYIPLIMFPAGIVLQILFRKKQMLLMVSWVMFFMLCMFFFLIWPNYVMEHHAYVKIGLVAAAWTIFSCVLLAKCNRCSLATS